MYLPIYMDSHSTTPVDPRVLDAMMPTFREVYGNEAGRSHAYGWRAEELVEVGRAQFAELIGAHPKEVIFTSGATEANNLAIKGVAYQYRERGSHIVTCVTEHKSVLAVCQRLEREGFQVDYLPVNRDGNIDLEQLQNILRDDTILVSLMAANNEIGLIHPIREISKIVKGKGVLFHCDATQAVGKIPINVDEMGIDLLSFSAHKLYGPKGVGALYLRSHEPRVKIRPMMDGGEHEYGLRAGTLNVPGIVGLGKACSIAKAEMHSDDKRLYALREKLRTGILDALDHVFVNGALDNRLSNNLNLSFTYVDADTLLSSIRDKVAVSAGSSCTSASLEPSHVLKALGIGSDLTHSSIRFGPHRFNTEEEITFVIQVVVDNVKKLRKLSPLYIVTREGIKD